MKIAAFCIASCVGLFMHAFAWAADAEECKLQRVAELPVKVDEGRLLIQVKIEGRDASVLVDTGSPFSMISGRLADELQLHKSSIASGRAYDAAGKDLKHFVKVKKLMLNGMTAEDQTFIVMGENDGSGEERPFDGIFGANFLSAYDIEFDIPHSKMNMFLHNHCNRAPVYWTQDFVAVPFVLDASLHMVMSATLDGKSVRAMVDTGAGPTILGAQTARRSFDFDPAASGQQPDGEERTGTGAHLAYYRHRFGVLDIGGVQFHNTELFILPDKLSRIARDHESHDITTMQSERNEATPLVIGMHHLAKIRAYVAYGQGTIYISSADAQ
jgi:predicted aspartyl protease